MSFVNTLPYISNPIEEFGDFQCVSYEKDIYPLVKGETKESETRFFVDLIEKRKLKKILDFGVGGGIELSGIIEMLARDGYAYERIEANEVQEDYILRAHNLFAAKKQNVIIHKANWLDLPSATPDYDAFFDFSFLTGNSLTLIGGGTREYTKRAQQSIVSKFAQLIKPGGYLFIDSRNYDYIRSLVNLPKEKILENFTFDYSVYYHGFGDRVVMFPAYISDTLVVLHFYDKESKQWCKCDVFPIYQNDMIDILSKDFIIERIYHDFSEEPKTKSLFVQYLARKK